MFSKAVTELTTPRVLSRFLLSFGVTAVTAIATVVAAHATAVAGMRAQTLCTINAQGDKTREGTPASSARSSIRLASCACGVTHGSGYERLAFVNQASELQLVGGQGHGSYRSKCRCRSLCSYGCIIETIGALQPE